MLAQCDALFCFGLAGTAVCKQPGTFTAHHTNPTVQMVEFSITLYFGEGTYVCLLPSSITGKQKVDTPP